MSHLRLSQEQYKALSTKGKPKNKYNAKKKVIDGIEFDSTKEARRYQDLALMQQAGDIRFLERQREFEVRIRDVHICYWYADFSYEARVCPGSNSWERVVEDVKGKRTPVYMLKRKLVEASYDIMILETR